MADDSFVLAGKAYSSRLLVGTGKYRDFTETKEAVTASGAQIVTVAVRRTNIGQDAGEANILDWLDPEAFTILPNTAGCFTAADAISTCELARELLDGANLVKLEVMGSKTTLYPDVTATLEAAEHLVERGFEVMAYTSDDPVQAKRLEEIGCVAVMPLGSIIGSGMGIINEWAVAEIVANAKVPVLVDAGVGTPSQAARAMELGCDAVLMNTAIAAATQPVLMASAMRAAVDAGRRAWLAGPMPPRDFATPSSPASHHQKQ